MISVEEVPYPDPELPLRIVRHLGTFDRDAYPAHVHQDTTWELCYVIEGRVSAQIAGRPRDLLPGEALVMHPDEPHGFEAWTGKHLTLMFRQPILSSTPVGITPGRQRQLQVAGSPVAPHVSVPSRRRVQVEYILDSLRTEALGYNSFRDVMCSMLLSQLLVELARAEREAGVEDRPSPAALLTVEQFCEELRATIDYPWTLSEMVQRSGYSASQLSLFFRQVTGVSPCRWLCEERVHRARELLTNTEDRVTDIAYEVGFGSQCHFGRVFRDIVGTTPTEYRNLMQAHKTPEYLQPLAQDTQGNWL